jgi:hypothetical protein
MFNMWALDDVPGGACCANWGSGSCLVGGNTCPGGGTCNRGTCPGDFGAACSYGAECLSGQCSPTLHECEVKTNFCNNGGYYGHPFTTMIAAPGGAACPAGMFNMWVLDDATGVCCANWGPDSCVVGGNTCSAGVTCDQGVCPGDFGADCTDGSQCLSGQCSPTLHKCEVKTNSCNNGGYYEHPFTTMFAAPNGNACPAGMFNMWVLDDAPAGVCCANWGPGSCLVGGNTCTGGTTCSAGLCL